MSESVQPLASTNSWNPADAAGQIGLSNNNLTATINNFGSCNVRSTTGAATGKSYWEYTFGPAVNTSWCGLCNQAMGLGQNLGSTSTNAVVMDINGHISYNGTSGPTLGNLGSNQLIGLAFDFGAQLFWMREGAAGNWNGSGTANPATGTGGLPLTGVAGVGTAGYAFVGGNNAGSMTITANFGASSFAGAVPSGFTAGFPPAAGGVQALVLVMA